jgi:hypothetical protein
MKNIYLFILVSFFTSHQLFSQSKKEVIANLQLSLDSVHNILDKERLEHQQDTVLLNNIIKSEKLDKEQFIDSITILQFSLGSVNSMLEKERFDHHQDTLLLNNIIKSEKLDKEQFIDSIKQLSLSIREQQVSLDSIQLIISRNNERNSNYNFNEFYIDKISLTKLLGKSIRSIEYTALVSNCSKPDVKKFDNLETYHCFYNEGIELITNKDDIISNIVLHTTESENYKKFKGVFGYGIDARSNKNDVDQRIGPIIYQTGDVFNSFFCEYSNGILIDYKYDGRDYLIENIHLSYTSHEYDEYGKNRYLFPEMNFENISFETIEKDLQLSYKNKTIIDSTFFDSEYCDKLLISVNTDMISQSQIKMGNKKYFIGLYDAPYGFRTFYILKEDGTIKCISENQYLTVVSATWYSPDNLFLTDCLDGFCNLKIYNTLTNKFTDILLDNFDNNETDCYSPYIHSVIPISFSKAALVIYFQHNHNLENCNEEIGQQVPNPIIKTIQF